MAAVPKAPIAAGQLRRQVLLHMKCLFWCLHEHGRRYNQNLAMHSLDRRRLHPDVADSHLGDNLQFLIDHIEAEGLTRIQDAIGRVGDSRAAMDIGAMHFEIGHYVQAVKSFGPIAEGAQGIISSVTPELRGLFLLEGSHVMESAFAPSDVRVIFGTYAS